MQKKYGVAKQYYDMALGMAKSMANEAIEGLVLESQAALNERQGHTTDALQLYSRAQEKYAAAGEGQGSARMLERLATDAEHRSEYERATGLYRKTRDGYVVAGDMLGVSRVDKALARTIPWGFLNDLRRGGVHPMRGERIMVGRDSPGYGVENDVSFPNQYISRRHLVINHDGFQTDDQRSTNGTAVNAKQIPYGLGVRLSDGDILTLANQEVLQFSTAKTRPHSPPPSAWGIFINGGEHDYRYLTEAKYALTIKSGKLAIEPGFSPSAMLELRYNDKKVEMFDVQDEWNIIYTQRERCTAYESCYEYREYIYPSGKWLNAIDLPSLYGQISQDANQIVKEGPSLQLVILKGND